MSDNSDASTSPIITKGKRKATILTTDSESASDSSTPRFTRQNGKRKNRVRGSDCSDSSVETPRKIKRVPRVTSDADSDSGDSDIVKRRTTTRVVLSDISDDLSESSESDGSGASDNGFEDDSTSDDQAWESDWMSDTSEPEQPLQKEETTTKKELMKPSTSNAPAMESDSSDGESEKCPICLLSFNNQEVGTPETCDHSFCAECIQEWSKNVNTCPVDRLTFTLVLVRKRYGGKVIRRVPVDVRRASVDELIQEDPTYCEICGMSDREDRLLLCDGCDLGYHLECLEPPMDNVPIEEWFCSECRLPPVQTERRVTRRHRQEPRLLPRTSQTERIRATIETNRSSALHIDFNSVSSGFEDTAMAGSSRGAPTRAPTTTRTRKTTKRAPRKKRKKRRKILYYEINDKTGEKVAVKSKVKRKKRKKRVSRKVRRTAQPKTVKKRLAFQLGMCAPKKVGLAIPEVKNKQNASNSAGNIGLQRSQAGIPTLHLFGRRDQLDYFSGSDDDAPGISGGVLTHARTAFSEASAMRRAARRKAVFAPEPLATVSSCDILGQILSSQEKLHSKHSVISVTRDGTIHIKNESKMKAESNNNLIQETTELETLTSPPPVVDVTTTDIETTQAPMFPNRGGGNRQPFFHRGGGGNYRGGGYDGGSNYNHYGGPPRAHRGAYGYNNQRDNNFGGGYFHHGGGGAPPPFRGRGGARFPMRRAPVQPPVPRLVEPIELVLDDPREHNLNDHSARPEEDVDIYSDIEAASSPQLDEDVYKSANQQVQTIAQTFNNSGTDDDSGSELVIDDTVKEVDKYDPADPSNDTDSNSEAIATVKEAECNETKSDSEVEPLKPPFELMDDDAFETDNLFETSLSQLVETTKLSNLSPQLVSDAVQQVLKEHMSNTTPTRGPSSSLVNYDDDEDSSDDCPNFSIYSATSIDIAKATELSVNIPKQDEISSEILAEQNKKEDDNDYVKESEILAEQNLKEDDNDYVNKESEILAEQNKKEDDNDYVNKESKILAEHTKEEDDNDYVKESEMLAKQNKKEDDCEELEESVQEPVIKEDEIRMSPKPIIDEKDLSDGEIIDIDDDVAHDNPPIKPETVIISVPKEEQPKEEIEDTSKKMSNSPIQLVLSTTIKKQATPIKIAFDPKRKSTIETVKKERVLQLYDDSDLEEWEYKNEFIKKDELDIEKNETDTEDKPQETDTELEKMTEAISEEERSYTPCLDEKEPHKGLLSDDEHNVGVGIGGMDTELISDDERNDIFDESHDMKAISDGDALEINAKESELDLTRPEDYEEGEIIEKLAVQFLKEVDEPQVEEALTQNSDDEKKKRLKQKKEIEKVDKSKEIDKGKKPEFKKISKSTKERNYRDKEKARSRSKEKKGSRENKENRRDKLRKEKKKDLERYNVRSIIAEKPKKDQFGRDIDRTPSRSSRSASPSRRSASRNRRSSSWNKKKKRRRRSSRSPKRSRSRSFSRGHTPRSRSRGRSLRNKSRSVRRSRSPRRSKSRSFRRSRSPRNKRYRLGHRSLSRERFRNRSRRRSVERPRAKKKIRSISRTKAKTRTPSPVKQRPRDWERKQSFEREWTPSWSRSPSPRLAPRHNLPESMSPSWTPPLAIEKGPVQPENLTVILTNNDVNKAKKKDKKKKGEKKQKDDYRKRKRSDRTPPPSKEVFASGDNILVSVSFNKTNEDNTREVLGVKRKRDALVDIAKKTKKDKNVNKEKKKRAKSPKSKKRNKEVANMKPVAIIDLDRSPFKELTPSPKDIIVLSDSDNCEKEDENIHDQLLQEEMMESQNQEDSAPQSPNYLNTTGPKTPPEPQIKFLLSTKQTQLRAISNPLHDPNDEGEVELDPQEELEHRLEDVLHKGPNTPPEPPSSPPSSPDAYDPFDPTKSRSPTPEPQTANQTNSETDKVESDGDLVDLAVGPLESSQKSAENAEKRLSLSPESSAQARISPLSNADIVIDSENKDSSEKNSKSPERISIGVVINQQIQQPSVVKPIISTAVYSSVTPTVITSAPALNSALPRTNLFCTSSTIAPRIATSVPQRIILPNPAKSSPAKMSPLKSSPAKPPIKSTPIKPMPSKTMISKLPVPNVKPLTPIRNKKSRPIGQNGNEVIDVDLDFESPYSPGSSDYEDLFEPPVEAMNSKRNKNTKSPAKSGAGGFDNLFGSSPVFRPQNNKKGKANTKVPVKMGKKSASAKGQNKTHVGVKIDEDNLKILDDLPNSAVEMQVKDKVCITSQQLPNSEFLKKLNRQERVVEEVKLVLKPHYNKKHVTKDQYKDILRRAVPKICHNKSGEINPKKIQNLIEAYVKKARLHKKPGNANPNTTGPATQNKTAKTTFWS